MESSEYYDFLSEGLAEEKMIRAHLAQDLYYIGRRLGYKMAKIRNAFKIFTIGLFITLFTTGSILFLF